MNQPSIVDDRLPSVLQPPRATRPAAHYIRHARRPSWGLAAFVWERDGKRAYRFEDGELRAFKRGFYHLLEPARPPADMSPAMLHRLGTAEDADGCTNPTLTAQLALLRSDYPEGFGGEKWQKERRGKGIKRRLKRHRDAAVEQARQALGQEPLERRIAAGQHEELWRDVVELLAASDLVPPAHVKRLRRISPSAALSHVLLDYLHGVDDESGRFEGLSNALGKGAFTWPIVTTLRALVDPLGELPVRPSIARAQAKVMGAKVVATGRPTARAYRDFVGIARRVRDWLEAQGERPTDLLDVADFMWLTLRPSARKRM